MTKEEFLRLASDEFDNYVSEKASKNLYDYESSLKDLLMKLGRTVMENELSPSSIHPKKKKTFQQVLVK